MKISVTEKMPIKEIYDILKYYSKIIFWSIFLYTKEITHTEQFYWNHLSGDQFGVKDKVSFVTSWNNILNILETWKVWVGTYF